MDKVAKITRALTEKNGRIVRDGFDLFIDGVWHERFPTKELARDAARREGASDYVVRINLHWRADNKVTLYMNGKKCVEGDNADMKRTGQKLVDEGKARWGATTFSWKKGEEPQKI